MNLNCTTDSAATARRQKILFICGSMNQTTQMHQIARHLPEFDCRFTPYYGDRALELYRRLGLIEFTILGNKMTGRARAYLQSQGLREDWRGCDGPYDLVLTCADLVVPKNIRKSPIVLVQEGMTDPEGLAFHVVRALRFLPRYIASTSAMGLSHAYEVFCVASPGYRDHFIRKGVDPDTLVVTGIPNFDKCDEFLNNEFPHRNYVLFCTSDCRETLRYENRKKTIADALALAGDRQLIFKLHPNENHKRAKAEIAAYAPSALVYSDGNTNHMIANCDILITQFSSTAFVGLALGKEVYSNFDLEELKRLLPLQHGKGAENIASVCRGLLHRAIAAEDSMNSPAPDLELAVA